MSSRATEFLFQRTIFGFERLDGPALELTLVCGHAVVHVPTGDEIPTQVFCKKCMQASEKGLKQLTEALTQ
jgi:hypothetical protein